MWIKGFSAASRRVVCQGRVLSLGGNLKYRLQDSVAVNSIVGSRFASSTSGLWLPNSNQVKFDKNKK